MPGASVDGGFSRMQSALSATSSYPNSGGVNGFDPHPGGSYPHSGGVNGFNPHPGGGAYAHAAPHPHEGQVHGGALHDPVDPLQHQTSSLAHRWGQARLSGCRGFVAWG